MQAMIRRHPFRFAYLAGAAALLILAALLLLPSIPVTPVGAQGTVTPTDTTQDFDERIRTFFEQLKTGSTTVAFDNLTQNSPLGAKTAGVQVTDMRTRYEETKRSVFGEILDWEKHGSKRIGADIVVVRYILKFENYPMIWTFTFYRKPMPQGSLSAPPISGVSTASVNPNAWTLIEMRFDSSLDLLSL